MGANIYTLKWREDFLEEQLSKGKWKCKLNERTLYFSHERISNPMHE